jgi:hypothetical protein
LARHGRGKGAWRKEEESPLARALRALRDLQDQNIAAHPVAPGNPAAMRTARNDPNGRGLGTERRNPHKHVKVAPYLFEGYEREVMSPLES